MIDIITTPGEWYPECARSIANAGSFLLKTLINKVGGLNGSI